ncbi:MAG: aldehyde ferredoxin oxidoreductase N-terminal domain-containing protein [Candidatus Bathyarchaeia archaeon]
MRGYAGKFLEVDLSDETVKEVRFPDQILRDYIGGRGLAAKLLWDRLGERWETVDPLGPENILTIFTGPLTGYYPGARLCVSGKSPQCNGIVGSTIGCELPIELRCAGVDGLIVSGRAEKPVYLWVSDEGAEIRDASALWGTGAIEFLQGDLSHRAEWIENFRRGATVDLGLVAFARHGIREAIPAVIERFRGLSERLGPFGALDYYFVLRDLSGVDKGLDADRWREWLLLQTG